MQNDGISINPIENPDPLKINGPTGEEIFRITSNGDIYWKGRFIEGDEELKSACTEMIRKMAEYMRPIEYVTDKGYELGSLEDAEEFANKRCHCYNCATTHKRMSTFIVCPKCGNKRCPHSTDHNLECTNSNAPNQPGSRY